MNIFRQYSLPNCTLILEGFDDGTGNALQTLAVLSNAECRFVTSRQSLNGGKVFFDHLVRAVSEYAQGLLSGIHHPVDAVQENGQMLIEAMPHHQGHRLLWQQSGAEVADNATNEVYLTTAEIFDLTEAIDQFLADGLTLPNFVLPLAPLSRRYCVPEESLAERVTPPLIGVSGFALTAFALFFAPIPDRVRPVEGDVNGSNNPTEQTTNGTVPPGAEASGADLDALVTKVSEIDDTLSLMMMQSYLYRTLDGAWTERPEGQMAAYRLSMTPEGSIVGYQPIDGTSPDIVNETPLPELSYASVDEAIANGKPVGQFKVVFKDKVLQVSPWHGFEGEVEFDNSQVRGDALRQLIRNTRVAITTALGTESVDTSQPLRYSVGVTDDGAIAFYISETSLAETSVNKTPLPKLIKPDAAGIVPGQSLIPTKPLTQVNVVFRPNGVVEVSPWAGYR